MNLSTDQYRAGISPISLHFAQLRKERAATANAQAAKSIAKKKSPAKASSNTETGVSRFAHLGADPSPTVNGPYARVLGETRRGSGTTTATAAGVQSPGESLTAYVKEHVKAEAEKRARLTAQARGEAPKPPSDGGRAKAMAVLETALRSRG